MPIPVPLDARPIGRIVVDAGPRWLRRLRLHTSLSTLADTARVSPSTLLTWMEPSTVLGAPWAAKSPLYPAPLDLWDGWAMEQPAPRQNALAPTGTATDTLEDRLRRWRASPLFLSGVGLPKLPPRTRLQGRVVPPTTLYLANGAMRYPHAWRALDALAAQDNEEFFVIAILRFSQEIGRKLPLHREIVRACLAPHVDRALGRG